MGWEFYDPRRPEQELLDDVQSLIEREQLLPDADFLEPAVLEAGRVSASDDTQRVYVMTSPLPAYEYDDDDLTKSVPLWRTWRRFFDAAVHDIALLWAGYCDPYSIPTLSELREPALAGKMMLSELWLSPALAPAVAGLELETCRREPLAGGIWVSEIEHIVRGRQVERDWEAHARDHERLRHALLAATEHLLPARDAPPYVPSPPVAIERDPYVDVRIAWWSHDRSAAQLYADLGYALVESGANPVEPLAWEDALPLPDGDDAFRVVLTPDDPQLVFFDALLGPVEQPWVATEQPGMEALHRWVVDLAARVGVPYALLDLDGYVQVATAPGYLRDADDDEGTDEVSIPPYSFTVDREWLGEHALEQVESLLHGVWRYDVGSVTGWWLRKDDPLGDERWARALEVANIIRQRARQ